MSFHTMFACLRPLAPTKIQNQTMPTGIPGSSPFRPRFHPHFAGPFSVSGVYIGLALGTLPCNLQHWGWNLKICGSFRQFFWFWCPKLFNPGNSGHSSLDFWIIECIKPGIYSMSGSWSCVVVNKQTFLEFAVFWDPECMETRKT